MRKKKFFWHLKPAVIVEDLSNGHYELGVFIYQIYQHRLVTSIADKNVPEE